MSKTLTEVNDADEFGVGSRIRGLLTVSPRSRICESDCSGLAHFIHVAPLFRMLQLLQYTCCNTSNCEMQTTDIPR